jgi:DNA mismatch repair ATPase MutL
MIGTALSEKEQIEILNKLDKTDVPWNCAHGRVSYDLTETALRKFANR